MKDIITTDKAPCAVGPYSQGVRMGNMLFTSGQVPLDPATGKVVEGDAGVQATQSLKNLQGVLEGAGFSMGDAVKVTVFITDMNDWAMVNEAYKKAFKEPYPARTCVGVATLPLGVKVEIEAIAMKA